MPARQPAPEPVEPPAKGRFRQPPEKRNVISDEGRTWQEENAEAARAWAEWIEKNGVPLRPLF